MMRRVLYALTFVLSRNLLFKSAGDPSILIGPFLSHKRGGVAKLGPLVCYASFVVLLQACSGCGGSSNVPPVTTQPSFTLSISTDSVSVIAGQQSQVTVSVTPLNGFTGTVSLMVSGIPTGVNASFSVNPVAVGQTSDLGIQAQQTLSPQSANLQITGSAGSLSRNQNLTLTVVGPGVPVTSRSAHTFLDGFVHDIAYDPVHKLVFCANTDLNEVEVISTATQTIVNILKIPQPYALDVAPDGSKLWVGTTAEFIYAVDLASMNVIQRITPRAAVFAAVDDDAPIW